MRKLLIVLLYCIIFVSCGQFDTLSRYKRNFTYCNIGQYTGLDSMINIRGWYHTGYLYNAYNKPFKVQKIDTLHLNIMFWDDGTSVFNFGGSPHTIQSEFDKIILKIEKGKKDDFFKKYNWGNYRIVGDTIKVQYIHVPFSLNDYWFGYERSFKIIDKNTLEYLPMMTNSLDHNIDKASLEEMQQNFKRENYFTFIPLERIPPPDCWLKKKKWFWCDNEKWERWKKEQKKIRKEKRLLKKEK